MSYPLLILQCNMKGILPLKGIVKDKTTHFAVVYSFMIHRYVLLNVADEFFKMFRENLDFIFTAVLNDQLRFPLQISINAILKSLPFTLVKNARNIIHSLHQKVGIT